MTAIAFSKILIYWKQFSSMVTLENVFQTRDTVKWNVWTIYEIHFYLEKALNNFIEQNDMFFASIRSNRRLSLIVFLYSTTSTTVTSFLPNPHYKLFFVELHLKYSNNENKSKWKFFQSLTKTKTKCKSIQI